MFQNCKKCYALLSIAVTLTFSVIQSLREMKGKIEREVRRRGLKDNIKLGAGGIREVEFIVQVFQLIRGGREINLQQHSLLKILPEITKLGLITEQQFHDLRESYIFFTSRRKHSTSY